jgi:dTDP-4-amino-4,6-dideoxygalactose transaminase
LLTSDERLVEDVFDRAGQGLGPSSTARTAERAAREVLSLPLFPGITPAQQTRVVSVFIAALQRA